MQEINLLKSYPRSKRPIEAHRSADPLNKAAALKFGQEYFDGTREQGYGGYKYDGRWVPIARDLVEHFGLKAGDRVLDVGCARGFLVKDLMDVCPGLEAFGLDISEYAIKTCHDDVIGRLHHGSADKLPFPDDSFAAVISINAIHNLPAHRCIEAIKEIERVAPGRGYIQVDSYRSPEEKRLFDMWVITAMTHFEPEGWREVFSHAGYTGAYYWTIAE